MDSSDMELMKQKLFKGIYFSIFIFGNLNNVYSQNNLKGDWKAQENDRTCWAASLSNLTNVLWTKEEISEDSITYGHNVRTRFPYFFGRAKDFFNYRVIKSDSVLTYEAINCYLRYKYPRPLIHSYNFQSVDDDEIGDGHFVNIVGCSRSNNLSLLNRKWLRVFDPKPDDIGTVYLKNYESYQILDPKAVNLQGTFFNFVRKAISLPRREDDDVKRAFYDKKGANIYNCDSCFSVNFDSKDNTKKFDFQNKIKEIISDPLFSEFVGKDIHFKKRWYLEVTEVIEVGKNDLKTIEKQDHEILIFNYAERDSLKGGTTLKYISSSKKYIIDRVENIGRYNEIKDFFQSKNEPQIVIVKDQFRFFRFKEKGEVKYLDMDNLFKTKKNEPISDSVFKQKIKPHYLKISESGKMILKSCQKILDLKEPSLNVGEGRFFLPASMKYSEYFEGSTNSSDSLTYILSKDIGSSDDGLNYFTLFFHSSDILKTQFDTYVPTKYKPNKIYSFTDESANSNECQLIFIPISEMSKIRDPETIDLRSELSKFAIKIEDIAQISAGRIESINGFMNTKQTDYFQNKKYANGIICDLLMKNGRVIPCYLVTRNNKIQWKK
jgi:hypothetical protein